MYRLHVGHAVLLTLVFAAACADPVSNPAGDQDVLADRSGSEERDRGRDRDDDDDDDGDGDRGRSNKAEIEVLDDCDPNDPGWAPTGGCTLKGGLVTEAEFNFLLGSPLSTAVVGHPAWRIEPSYVVARAGKKVTAENEGGRFHTFTRVAQFGGGRVPPLSQGLSMAPECALAPGAGDPNGLAPGAELRVAGLAGGVNRYQCCIHPWMRAEIKVTTN